MMCVNHRAEANPYTVSTSAPPLYLTSKNLLHACC